MTVALVAAWITWTLCPGQTCCAGGADGMGVFPGARAAIKGTAGEDGAAGHNVLLREVLRWSALIVTNVLCFALAIHGARHGSAPMTTVMLAVMLASGLSSVAGFAFSAICGGMLFHLVDDPVQAVQIMFVTSIANQAAMVWSIRHDVTWRELGVFLAGGAVGLPVGIGVLLCLDRTAYTHALGGCLIVYGGYMLIRKSAVVLRWQPTGLDILAGFVGGVTGGAAAFPSAPVVICCSLKGWSKERQRAVFQPFILMMQIVALLAVCLLRSSGGSVGIDPGALLCMPAGLLGTAIGLTLYRRLSDAHFGRSLNVLLIASGLSYVV